jgi:uncharacterized protein (TIGR00251 family)
VSGRTRLAVRLTPRARADRILGLDETAPGRPVLRAAVAAPASEGRANAALLRLIAREFGLRLGELAIVAGARSRDKVVEIAGDPEALRRFLLAIRR